MKLNDKKIEEIYKSLMKDLNAFLGETFTRYADSDGRLYLSYLDEHRQRAAFLQQIVDNVDNIAPALKDQMQDLINTTYEECYKGMADSVKMAYTSGEVAELVKDIDVNPETLQAAVNNNISKLTLPAVLEKHRAEIIYQIQRELTVGMLNGDRYEKMAKRISERVRVSQSKAMNITRTETHSNVESGFQDCAERIQDELDGSDLVYVKTYRTMKDERVRPQQRRKTKSGWKTTISKNGANHQNMEGITIPVNEMFVYSDGVKTKNPGASGVARHDCQCRCFCEFNLLTKEEYEKVKKNGGRM